MTTCAGDVAAIKCEPALGTHKAKTTTRIASEAVARVLLVSAM
jgi:hypothetical protein